jgi:hypothetical protein
MMDNGLRHHGTVARCPVGQPTWNATPHTTANRRFRPFGPSVSNSSPAINPASEAVQLQIGTLAAMSASILATACKISFHRRSSSAAGKMEDAADQGGLRFFASRGDEPIGWINSIVLSTGMGDLVAGPLQVEFQLPRSGP